VLPLGVADADVVAAAPLPEPEALLSGSFEVDGEPGLVSAMSTKLPLS
jgi:hypothetical protein